MSGSLVFRSGVGTQMLIVSSSSTAEKSVVARSFPEFTRGPSTELGMSPTYESPAFTRFVFSWLRSIPVTVKPALAYSTASGSPTYPRPTIPTRAVRDRIFSSRTFAVDSIAGCASGISPPFSHSGPFRKNRQRGPPFSGGGRSPKMTCALAPRQSGASRYAGLMAQNEQEFERLKAKYQPAIDLMQQLQVRLQNLHLD